MKREPSVTPEARIFWQVWVQPEPDTPEGLRVQVGTEGEHDPDLSVPRRIMGSAGLRNFIDLLPPGSKILLDLVTMWTTSLSPWPYITKTLGDGKAIEFWVRATRAEFLSCLRRFPAA